MLPSETARWRLLIAAAKKGAEAKGYTLTRVPGRGLSNVWQIAKDGKTQRAAIRTTRDRWIAFPPLHHGTKWKTLDDVEVVIVAAVDSKDDPENIEVYIFPADEVRQRFDAAYAARIKAGHVVREDFGMWVGLDYDTRPTASSAGSGIIQKYPRVALYPVDALASVVADQPAEPGEQRDIDQGKQQERAQEMTIADVMAWARERVAKIAGVRVEAVKLDLKLEY